MPSFRLRSIILPVCAAVLLVSASHVAAQQAFTDDPLVAGGTTVRAVHITELRARIDTLRVLAGLTPFGWTDPTITPGVTTVRAVHLQELRNALSAAASGLGRTAPSYAESVASGSTIKAAHITELRTIIKTWETAGTTGSGSGSGGTTGGNGSGSVGGTGAPSTLTAGQVLTSLTSPDGRFQFVYQNDGNIVLYQGAAALWSSGTSGPGYAVMQGDGNFVLYSVNGGWLWQSDTDGYPNTYLAVQDDGTAAIRDSAGTIVWSTATSQGRGSSGGTSYPDCVADVAPRMFRVPDGQTLASVTISADGDCRWDSASDVAWIHVDPSTHSGSGSVQFSVDDAGTVARTGTLVVGGNVVTIVQGETNNSFAGWQAPTTPFDLDGDGLDDALEQQLATSLFPRVWISFAETCLTPFEPKPVVFRVRPLVYQGIPNFDYIQITYVLLYNADCGADSHPGDNESFMVFAHRVGTEWVFDSLSTVAHAGDPGARMGASFHPELWVSANKHGNYADVDQCNEMQYWGPFPIGRWDQCDSALLSTKADYTFLNAGEPDHPLHDDLGVFDSQANTSGWGGECIWRADQTFFGAGHITGDLFNQMFPMISTPPGFRECMSTCVADSHQECVALCSRTWDRESPFRTISNCGSQ